MIKQPYILHKEISDRISKIQPPQLQLRQSDHLPTFLLKDKIIFFISKPRKNYNYPGFLHYFVLFWHYFDIPNDNKSPTRVTMFKSS